MSKSSLYHYCSVDTFMKIMQNSTIRVSDSSKTNDYTETQWIITMFKEFIINSIVNDLDLCKIYNPIKLEYMLKNQLERTIEAVYFNNSRYMFTFISCFSEEPDLLSQWRGYADNGQGLSIGFDKDILMSFDTGGYNYHFRKVIYEEEEQKNYVLNFFGDLINSYKKIEPDDGEEILPQFIQDIARRVGTIRNESPRFKNSAFSEEKEWRLIINNHFSNYNCEYMNDGDTVGNFDENYSEKAIFNNGFTRNPLRFFSKANTIVPYFDLSFKDIKNKLINTIYIGPKCNIKELELRLFLESHGYNWEQINIRKSSATYR